MSRDRLIMGYCLMPPSRRIPPGSGIVANKLRLYSSFEEAKAVMDANPASMFDFEITEVYAP